MENEIITALEDVRYHLPASKHKAVIDEAIESLKSLQAEIKMFERQNRCLISEVKIKENNLNHLREMYNDAHTIVKKVNERFINKCKELQAAKAEIEKNKPIPKHGDFFTGNVDMGSEYNKKLKAEAIKEFAVKLKIMLVKYDMYGTLEISNDIDNLVAEMVGAENE